MLLLSAVSRQRFSYRHSKLNVELEPVALEYRIRGIVVTVWNYALDCTTLFTHSCGSRLIKS